MRFLQFQLYLKKSNVSFIFCIFVASGQAKPPKATRSMGARVCAQVQMRMGGAGERALWSKLPL